MTLVQIDKESIKPNPRAGATSTAVHGRTSITFAFHGQESIPDHLIEKVVFTRWENTADPKRGDHQEGHILQYDDVPLFEAIPGIVIQVDQQVIRMDHAPEPKYLYAYEDPIVNCGTCGSDVLVSQIRSSEFWDGEEETYVDQICPYCSAHYSFGEIRYESIDDAIQKQ